MKGSFAEIDLFVFLNLIYFHKSGFFYRALKRISFKLAGEFILGMVCICICIF